MVASQKTHQLDPVFVNSLREAKLILAIFALFFLYTIGVSFLLGSRQEPASPEEVPTVLGMPSWVFWGIAVPWGAANVVTGWFCFRFMRQDTLEDVSTSEAVLSEKVDGAGGGSVDEVRSKNSERDQDA